jgi:hypothetical protein
MSILIVYTEMALSDSRVASTLGITARDSNRGTFSADNLNSDCRSSSVCFERLHACGEFGCTSSIGRALVVDEFYIFEMVRPYAQSTRASGFPEIAALHYISKRLRSDALSYSWPVFLITSRILFFRAKFTPATMSAGEETLMAYLT